jgi:hypothetical protein
MYIEVAKGILPKIHIAKNSGAKTTKGAKDFNKISKTNELSTYSFLQSWHFWHHTLQSQQYLISNKKYTHH